MKHMTLILAPLLAVGCTAGRSFYYLWDAERELIEAQEAGAPDKAVYEYTLAREYLHKAREEQGYSDYKDAEKLSRLSIDWAAKATDVSLYGSSERELMLKEIGEEVPDVVVPEDRDPLVPIFESNED